MRLPRGGAELLGSPVPGAAPLRQRSPLGFPLGFPLGPLWASAVGPAARPTPAWALPPLKRRQRRRPARATRVSHVPVTSRDLQASFPRALQCPAISSNVLPCPAMSGNVQQCPAMSCNVQQCPAMSCNVQQCSAMSSNLLDIECPATSAPCPARALPLPSRDVRTPRCPTASDGPDLGEDFLPSPWREDFSAREKARAEGCEKLSRRESAGPKAGCPPVHKKWIHRWVHLWVHRWIRPPRGPGSAPPERAPLRGGDFDCRGGGAEEKSRPRCDPGKIHGAESDRWTPCRERRTPSEGGPQRVSATLTDRL